MDKSKLLAALALLSERESGGKDAGGSHVKSDESFFFGEAPKETAEQRLDRYIEFMHKYRPRNILEAVIVPYYGGITSDDDDDHVYQARWVPVLESRGFKKVNEAGNSNSSNIVQVWHLIISPEAKPKSLEDKPVALSPNPFR